MGSNQDRSVKKIYLFSANHAFWARKHAKIVILRKDEILFELFYADFALLVALPFPGGY